MTFRFEYRFYKKYIINKDAGFGIIVDDEFENIEILYLSSMNKVVGNKYIYISQESKSKIKELLINNQELFNINSYLYLEGINKEHEQLFYFELNDRNRKVEGCNIIDINDDNNQVQILISVFKQISMILLSDNIILELDKIKNDKWFVILFLWINENFN